MTATRRQKWISLLLAAIPAVVAVLLYLLLPLFPGFTETVMTGGVFRALSVPYGWLMQWLSVSVTELLVVLGIPAAVVLLVIGIVRVVRAPQKKAALYRLLRPVAWVLSVLLLLYMLLHGVNYYRRTAADLMGLELRTHTTAELATLSNYFAGQAATVRAELTEAPDGTVQLEGSLSHLLAEAGEGYAALDDTYPFLWGATNRVKPVLLSHAWSYTGITGMYFPMLAEANVNIDQPLWCVPFTAAHELAHTRGFAREDECNFLAFLSCSRHPSVDYRYSGYYMAYIYCINALNRLDAEQAQAIAASVDEGFRRDLTAQSEYWDAFEGPVQEVSDSINSGFISSQGVPDGSYSYGRCVDLMLAWAETEGIL